MSVVMKKACILFLIPLLASCGELSVNSGSESSTSHLFVGLTAMDIENLEDEYWAEETSFTYQGYGFKAVGIREARVAITNSNSDDQYDYCIDLKAENGMISSTDWQNSFESLEITYVPQQTSGELSISSGGQSETAQTEIAETESISSSEDDDSHLKSIVIDLEDADWKIENVSKTPIYIYSLSLY